MKTIICAICIFFLSSCALTEQERQAAIQNLDTQVATGQISQAQRDVLVDQLNQGDIDWEATLYEILQSLLGLGAAIGFIRLQRGPSKKMDTQEVQTLRQMIHDKE